MPIPPNENFSQYGYQFKTDSTTSVDNISGLSYYTSLDGASVLSVSNRDYYVDDCENHNVINRPVFALEKHMTVVRKGPTMPPTLEMHPYEQGVAEVNVATGDDAIIQASFLGSRMHQSSNWADLDVNGDPMMNQAPNGFNTGLYWGDPDGDYNKRGTAFDGQDISMFYKRSKELVSPGDNVNIPIDINRTGEDWKNGDHILIEHEYTDSFGGLKKATARLQIVDVAADGFYCKHDSCNNGPFQGYAGWGYYPSTGSSLGSGSFWSETHVVGKVVSMAGNFPQGAVTDEDLYNVKLVQRPAIFEVKFPRFSYRYKYADGEYSTFAPWSEIAFIPGRFDFLPKKGYNLGMENRLRTLNIKNWIPKNIPKDVVQVDLLYKESNSPNVYTVSSHKKDDPVEGNGPQNQGFNYWQSPGNGGHSGFYTITSELIHKVVKSNQMLRPWDNVPRRALGQEVTANRLIFANYVQNYDLKDVSGNEVKAQFLTTINSEDYSSDSSSPLPGYPGKSLKSMRTYQLGVVYRDKYGRETPVLTSESGSIKLSKEKAKLQNRLSVKLENQPPLWAESFTFYIKETSNEYYNLSMDRWYDAEDGGIWLSFPSSERNKISERTNLILKKQHDTNVFTDFDTTYKVLALKSDAPNFIKTENRYWGSLPMMLPPPGWGQLGSWDSGMFYNTGLPLPNRMYLDIFAEYWNQSPFNELTSMSGAQIRVIQSAGASSAYNAATSDTTNKTRWYDISSISYIGSPPQTQQVTTIDDAGVEITSEVELPGQQEQLVRVSLEKAFGNDALFCEPSDNLSISRGLSLECRTKIVREKSQFEGRFFVKILRDANVEQNIIQPQLETEDKYQVLFSRKLKYICAAHPGMQDWSKKIIHRDGSYIDKANFIPVGITQKPGDVFKWGQSGAAEGISSGVNDDLYHVDNLAGNVTRPKLVSSLSYTHAGKGASFTSATGSVNEAPDGTNFYGVMWPIGPGSGSIGAFDCRGWNNPNLPHFQYLKDAVPGGINKLIWPDYRTSISTLTDGGIPDGVNIPVVSNGNITMSSFVTNNQFDLVSAKNDWPSFGPEKFSPYSMYENSTNYAITASGPYENRIKENIAPAGISHQVITIKDAPALTGALSNSDTHPNIIDNYESNNYLQGANPTQLPAIWGNQDSFFRGSCVDCEADGGDYTGIQEYNATTFAKLREDWWYLWRGRDEVDESWPLGRHSPERWIIDKAGAAMGYSGNGIWADESTGIGYMDISFWGVGKGNSSGLSCRKHDSMGDTLKEFNDNEFGFAQALRTPGTQFRFTHDPDKIVYTITKSEERDVYNYEAPQGIWASYDVDNDTYVGGAGIGYNSQAPWGGPKSGALAGGRAYISDLFAADTEMVGSHPSNKRIRWTLTLDKIIGAEGEHNFHPIKNHVEPTETGTYKSNIEIGRAKYSTGLPSGHVTADKGGTPDDIEFYNLASYWNTTLDVSSGQLWSNINTSDQTGGGFYGGDVGSVPSGLFVQPDEINLDEDNNYYARNPQAYIGLHERGLNQTEIEIVTPYRGEDRERPMSTNPAIWETEPLEDVGLDIYYAASPSYPINLEKYRQNPETINNSDVGHDWHNADWYDYSYRGEEVVRVGSLVEVTSTSLTDVTQVPVVCSVQGNTIWLTPTDINTGASFSGTNASGDIVYQLETGDEIKITWRGEGTFYGVGSDKEWVKCKITQALSNTSYKIEPIVHNNEIGLGYFNCWTYNNGVESNRVRDDYNAVTIDKGVKASMPLATPYEEERRSNGLIFSGIYNSTSGINETNQFIQAEPITKDLNPINGSIQKLFARDTDLVTFCENKVFKILANKDALFNANGDVNVTSNNAVLGQAIPFSGEYGISKNPESFASESYRVYFTDKDRGSVLRLSRDGLTPISDQGMKDWFRDNLKNATSLMGSYDERDKQYNLTIDTSDENGNEKAYTVSYTESKRGWVSFKSFITQGGLSHKNTYYTFPSNKYSILTQNDPWGISYEIDEIGRSELWQHSLDQTLVRNVSVGAADTTTFQVNDNGYGSIIPGMYVEGNGIPLDCIVKTVSCSGGICSVELQHSNPVTFSAFNSLINFNVEMGTEITFVTPRNHFYSSLESHYSMIKVLLNGDKGTVKRFKTLDYEGSQAFKSFNDTNVHKLYEGITENIVGEIYHDNYLKMGWFVENIETDLQEGKVNEFINKENKWFNKITQGEDAGIDDNLDTGEFSLQGLGKNFTIS